MSWDRPSEVESAVEVETVTGSVSPNALLFAGLCTSDVAAEVEVPETEAVSLLPPHDSRTIVALDYAFIYFLITSSLAFFYSSVISVTGVSEVVIMVVFYSSVEAATLEACSAILSS